MKQEFVTLPREVVEQAIEALFCTDSEEGSTAYKNELEAVKKLRAALDRLQAEQDPTPNGATHIQLQQGAFYKRVDGKWYVWSLVKNGEPHRWYISPGTAESCLEPLATTPKQKHEPLTIEQPQAEQPAMTPIAQRKLDSLLAEGYTISGYSVYHEQKHQHGFVTGAGLVGWWRPEGMEHPQPLGEQEPFTVLVRKRSWLANQWEAAPRGFPDYGRSWADERVNVYTHPQPKRDPLTDDQIDAIADAMPGGLEGFLRGWGWRQFARAVLEATHNIK